MDGITRLYAIKFTLKSFYYLKRVPFRNAGRKYIINNIYVDRIGEILHNKGKEKVFMKLKKLRGMASLLLAGALLFTSVSVPQAPSVVMAAEEGEILGTADRWQTVDEPTLRDYATPSVNYVGYGMGPDNFADANDGGQSFWNAHGDPLIASRAQWMKYDFGARKATITGMIIKFFDDGNGVFTPTDIKAEYKDDAGNWMEISRKDTWVMQGNTPKTYEFATAVTTSAIRVTMVHANNQPVAVYDWKLLGEVPADFPKPEVVPPEDPSPDLSLPDVAVYAVPSAHENHTSAWEKLDGINNENFEPVRSDGGNGQGWGNWGCGHAAGQECWLQYDWDEEITTKTFQVYWYGSDAGMKIPSNVRFQYQDANGAWKDAVILSHKKNYSKYDKYNQITIEQITTKAIRMYMTIAGDSVGVYRWKVHANANDEFVVSAAANSLEIPEVKKGRVASRICKKLTLPATAMNNRVNVTWKSKNPDVIADDGTVKSPAQDTKVTLTATCTKADQPSIKKDRDIEIMVLSDKTTEYAMTIDRTKKGVDISQELYGVFYEDINSSADGGLSAELVKNNSFENYQNLHATTSPAVKGDQRSWKLHWNSSNAANFVVERTDGLNNNNKNYAKITGNQTLSNHGFVGRATLDKSAMAIRKDMKYDFSMYMKAASNYAGTVKVKVVDDAGTVLTNEATLNLKKDGTWQKVSTSLTGNAQKLGTLVLTFEGAGAADAMYIDMVSLIPTDGYGYGNKNYSYGAGLRKDLVEKLQQLGPDFIRFPGGCVVEGSYGLDGYYNWEDSVGPLEERRAIGSYWGSPWKSVNYGTGQDNYGYMMSYQFGYHEILTLCEDLGAQPFPILSAGIFCQFTEDASASVSGEQLKPFADHATHLIDYCWGDPNSSDATQAQWAKKRVANGHEEPFDLNYLGIGNENWEQPELGVSYYANFKWIKDYVEKYVKEHYPNREITLISSTGPYYQGGQNTSAWNWINRDMPGETLVDEHYYINYTSDGDNTLLNSDYIYDNYKRLNEGGSNVFVGEYAGHLTTTKENVLDTAISEAAYMTGLERNGDIVRHASYAPLFEREGCRDWDYNLIKFDAFDSYGTPSYYVQTMYSNNYGKHIIDTTLEEYNDKTSAYDKKPGHQTDLYYVTSEDDNYLYTKLANHADYSKEITLNYPGIKDGAEVELICLSGKASDMNTMENPTKIAPVTTKKTLTGERMTYEVPAMSLTVVKVTHTQKSEEKPPVVDPPVVVDKKALNTAITTAKTKKQIDYTTSSWNKFTASLTAAQNVVRNTQATQAQVDTAKKNLDAAVKGLVKLGASSTKKVSLGVGETYSVKTKNCTYLSSNTKLATVSTKGVVKAKKTGSVTIKAIPKTGTKAKVFKITVKKAPNKISKVTFSKKAVKKKKVTLKKGKSGTFKVTLPKGTASKITYTSSKKKIATVSSTGKVKAKKKGTTTITIKTFNKKSVKIKLTVK